MMNIKTISPSRTYVMMVAKLDFGYEFIQCKLPEELENNSVVATNKFATESQQCVIAVFPIEQFRVQESKNDSDMTCPFCRSDRLQLDDKPVFVERGDYDEDTYEDEGNSERFHCLDCHRGFIPW